MKIYTYAFIFIFILMYSCSGNKKISNNNNTNLSSDTIRIANEDIDYEVIIIDGQFTTWFNSNARPRSFYTQSFLEARNRLWVIEYNNRANFPTMGTEHLYEMPINYQSTIDYGFEVNYMIFNYLVYFQTVKKQNLGGFPAQL